MSLAARRSDQRTAGTVSITGGSSTGQFSTSGSTTIQSSKGVVHVVSGAIGVSSSTTRAGDSGTVEIGSGATCHTCFNNLLVVLYFVYRSCNSVTLQ